MRTPTSLNSRKSSIAHASAKRLASLTQPMRTIQPSEVSVKYQIFTTVDDSQYVVCTPPFSSSQVGFTKEHLKEKLQTPEDIAQFDAQKQICQLYAFDKVVNDMYDPTSITKLYNKVIKNKVSEQWPNQSLCVLLFGPSDPSKTRKESGLLTCDAEFNLALKAAKELLTKSQETRGNHGLIYCSVM